MDGQDRNLVEFLLEVATLKWVPRTGWLTRGVVGAESVAEHSFGTAWVALALADAVRAEGTEPGLDLEKVLLIALLHDLAEVRLTDLPSSATRLIHAEVKSQAEAAAMGELLAPLAGAESLAAWWHEFESAASPEGRLVRDADKLEMMVQCLRYEQAGNRGLEEFWQAMDSYAWQTPQSERLYQHLRSLRSENRET